ncbi:ribonuclease H-like domain-containing protein [Tanacetum coccineum]
MVGCNSCQTPIDTESKLGDDGDPVCLHMHNPREPRLSALKRVLRSTSGYYVFLGNNLLSWSSKHEPTLSCSSAKAEYRGVANVHQRMKHIEIDIHFVRDFVATGQVRVLHVPSRYQFADIFTKGFPSALFEEFRTSLSVQCPPAPTAGEC